MDFIETYLQGAYIIEIKKIEDDRGFFSRGWCQNEFNTHNLNPNIVQINIGFSYSRGTLRGLHFQKAPWEEAKLVRCTRGSIYDVIIDLRRDSKTCGKWFGVELTEENHKMIYSPEGFAQGYLTLTENAEIYYQTSQFYVPEFASGVRYNDAAFGIVWPIPIEVISKQDQNWPSYSL
jgi:dTDP-4-dehydrorhamnose 3,5-epimerase